MSATNRGAKRQTLDSYQTPPWAIRALLAHVKPFGKFLEPCRGSGNIEHEVASYVVTCDGGDLMEGWDFLTYMGIKTHDWVITNPPYSLACEFIDRSLACAQHVAMLLRLNFLESEMRRAWWQTRIPTALYVLAKRPAFLDREGKLIGKGTDACAYGWFVWSRLYSGIHVIGGDDGAHLD